MGQNLRAIRRKIKTVKSISQITRAMQMVSAAKLKRVQPRVEASREYMRRLAEVTASVAGSASADLHPYLRQGTGGSIGLVIVAGDKGLCGSHNVNLFRAAEEFLAAQTEPVLVFCVGQKALDFARRRKLTMVTGVACPSLGDEARGALQIARQVRALFDGGQLSVLHVVYTEFRSPMQRPPAVRQVLPIDPQEAAGEAVTAEYLFEPAAPELLGSLLPRTVEAGLVNVILQSMAAEHAARMTAMSAATENADELRSTLTRELNRARQQQITSEILEVVSGADALQQGD